MKHMDFQGVLGVPVSPPVMPEVRNLWARCSEVSYSSKVLHIYYFLLQGCPSSLCPRYEFQQFAGREKIIAFYKSSGYFFENCLPSSSLLASGFSVPACGGCGLGASSIGADEGS